MFIKYRRASRVNESYLGGTCLMIDLCPSLSASRACQPMTVSYWARVLLASSALVFSTWRTVAILWRATSTYFIQIIFVPEENLQCGVTNKIFVNNFPPPVFKMMKTHLLKNQTNTNCNFLWISVTERYGL